MFTLKDLRTMFYKLFNYEVDTKVTKIKILHAVYQKLTGTSLDPYRTTLTKGHLMFILEKLHMDYNQDDGVYKLEADVVEAVVTNKYRIESSLNSSTKNRSIVNSRRVRTRSRNRSRNRSHSRKRKRIKIRRKKHGSHAHRKRVARKNSI